MKFQGTQVPRLWGSKVVRKVMRFQDWEVQCSEGSKVLRIQGILVPRLYSFKVVRFKGLKFQGCTGSRF